MSTFIHIGAEKCGSTSIQKMLDLNFDFFVKNNIFSPRGLGRATAPLNHARLTVLCYPEEKKDDLTSFFFRKTDRQSFFNKTINDLQWSLSQPFENHLFSCEHYSSRLNTLQEVQFFYDLFRKSANTSEKIYIVLVVRNQFDWHLSAYNTYIKCGGKLKLEDWLKVSLSQKSACWLTKLNLWSSVFGKDFIRVIPLKDPENKQPLETRFLEACNFKNSLINAVKIPPYQNESSSPQVLEKIRLINLDHDWMHNGVINSERVKLIKNLEDANSNINNVDNQFSMDVDKIKAHVKTAYEEANQKLAAEYSLSSSTCKYLEITG